MTRRLRRFVRLVRNARHPRVMYSAADKAWRVRGTSQTFELRQLGFDPRPAWLPGSVW